MNERLGGIRKRIRSKSAPPANGHRRSLLHDHYRVDPEKRVVLPGVPKHDEDWDREMHDFFNLIALVPLVVLNCMNWNWDLLLNQSTKRNVEDRWSQAWTGEWFGTFWYFTMAYFIVDLIWVLVIPKCVKSPGTIIKHHIATLIYILIPYHLTRFQWCMGACMSVEINTWFLIARRVFNKQGFPPWIVKLPPLISIRIKLISIFFYVTWISVRCFLYPYLFWVFIIMWQNHSKDVGSKSNIFLIILPLHAVFCVLNLRWTFDLLMSKIRFWRRSGKKNGAESISKGL